MISFHCRSNTILQVKTKTGWDMDSTCELSEVEEMAFMCSGKGQKMEETTASTAAECSSNYNVAAEQLSPYIIVAGIHSQV